MRLFAAVAALLAVTLTLSACATPDGSPREIRSTHLPTILEQVRGHPERRETGEAACERSLTANGSDPYIDSFLGGLFDVPAERAASEFCVTLVEAVIAGDLTRTDIDAFKKPAALRGMGPLGTLMRSLLAAQERLYAQQAQKPPQAQSCGCGQ
ncbi:hypothetical protein [Pelagibius sp. 7325]|uniref:hypothetical protein n=1 Tax=Pelagibius sp. 7325 TaxID=3131994 RepID=UPI0030EF3FBB